MRWVWFVIVVISLAGSAQAQWYFDENAMGLFFVAEIDEDHTNIDTGLGTAPRSRPFQAYLMLTNCDFFTLAAYEVGISFDKTGASVLDATGPNGWTNFGSRDNHLVGYQTPLPIGYDGTVLSTLTIRFDRRDLVYVYLGPSNPSSVGGEGPGIANGENSTQLAVCGYVSNPNLPEGLVATLNGDGIYFPWYKARQVEERSLSAVKALF
jgi:hypothetical protein